MGTVNRGQKRKRPPGRDGSRGLWGFYTKNAGARILAAGLPVPGRGRQGQPAAKLWRKQVKSATLRTGGVVLWSQLA